jgi:hypothetical protein
LLEPDRVAVILGLSEVARSDLFLLSRAPTGRRQMKAFGAFGGLAAAAYLVRDKGMSGPGYDHLRDG